MQASPEELPPLGIVFDSDLGAGVGDILALALLYGAQGREDYRTRVAAVSLSNPSLDAAAYCEALERFNAAISNREIPVRFRRDRTSAVGLAEDGPGPKQSPVLAEVLSQKNGDGEALYRTEIRKLTDTADPAALIRNSLTAYHDQNTVVLMTGPATNLAKVLTLNGAKELIAAKVKYLSVAAGAYPTGDPETNILADIEAARKVFAEWPTPIVAAGYELGQQAPYPAESIENDFGWTERHPVVEAYRRYGEMPYDSRASDLAAALYAARPESGYFGLSEPGTIEVMDDGRTRFTASPEGKHRYLTIGDSRREGVLAAYRQFVAQEPAPRVVPRRFQALIEAEKKREEEERLKKEQEAAEQEKE